MTSVIQRGKNGGAAIVRGVYRGRWLVAVGLLMAALAVGAVAVWRQVGQHVAASDQFRIDPKNIEITPPPPWVRGDIKASVIRDTSLTEKWSMLDPRLTIAVSKAFALNAWVSHVQRVSKSSSGIVQVELVYRRPAAMVEVSGGLLPVDVEGILLPTDDFSPVEASAYPRLVGVQTMPRGPDGTLWGDPAVAQGARLAALLTDAWREFHLTKIIAVQSHLGAPPEYELVTQSERRIPWGRAPGSEIAGEMSGLDKLARLRRHYLEFGTLDEAANRKGLELVPRAASAGAARSSGVTIGAPIAPGAENQSAPTVLERP